MARTSRRVDLALTLADAAADVPLRHLIGDALVGAIRTGAVRPGDPLPATRALAVQLGVSRTAVVHAYDELMAAGYVRTRPGSGTFVAPGADRAAAAGASAHVVPSGAPSTVHSPTAPSTGPPTEPLPQWWSLSPSSPDTSVLDGTAWRRAWRVALAGGVGAEIERADGHPRLRAALAEHLRRTRGVLVDPEEILITPGVAATLRPLFEAMGLSGATLAMEAPGYRAPRRAAASTGVRLRAVRVDSDGLDPDSLRRDDAAVYVTPAHQFPLGGRLPAQRRADLLTWAGEHGGRVIEDDYDGEYRYDVSPLPALRSLSGAGERVVYLGTSSKILAPSLRLGWAVPPPGLHGALRDALADHGHSVNVVAARALAELIASGELTRHLARAGRLYAARRAGLVAALGRHLPQLRLTGVDAGLHLVVLLPPGVDDATVAAAARARGIGLDALADYGHEGGPGLVLGYAMLPTSQADRVVADLADVVRRHWSV